MSQLDNVPTPSILNNYLELYQNLESVLSMVRKQWVILETYTPYSMDTAIDIKKAVECLVAASINLGEAIDNNFIDWQKLTKSLSLPSINMEI